MPLQQKIKFMRKVGTLFIGMLFLGGAVLAGPTGEVGGKAKKAAKQMCKCVEPLVEITHRLEEVEKNNDEEGAMKILEELPIVEENMMECIRSVDVEDIGEDELKDAMKKRCPETFELLFGDEE